MRVRGGLEPVGKQIRVVSLALVALFAAVALVACGEGDDEPIVEEATRIAVEGAPTELPTPDVLTLTAEAATAEAEAAAEDAAAASPVVADEGAAAPAVRLEGYDIGWRTADQPGPQVELTL